MGLVTTISFIGSIYQSSIVGLQRQIFLNVLNSAMATLRGLGAVGILIWVSESIEVFFIWQALVSIATLIILAFTTYYSLPIAERVCRFSLGALRGVWKFTSGIIGITFLALLLTQEDEISLSKLLTLREYGHYTHATVEAAALYKS